MLSAILVYKILVLHLPHLKTAGRKESSVDLDKTCLSLCTLNTVYMVGADTIYRWAALCENVFGHMETATAQISLSIHSQIRAIPLTNRIIGYYRMYDGEQRPI